MFPGGLLGACLGAAAPGWGESRPSPLPKGSIATGDAERQAEGHLGRLWAEGCRRGAAGRPVLTPLCSSPQYDEHVISPKEFVHLAGKSTLKDWKRAIRMNGIMLRWAGQGWGGARGGAGPGRGAGPGATPSHLVWGLRLVLGGEGDLGSAAHRYARGRVTLSDPLDSCPPGFPPEAPLTGQEPVGAVQQFASGPAS